MDREYGYDTIRGIGMLMIMWYHINTTIHALGITPSFPLILDATGCLFMGGVGVAMFFALSGAVLARNYCNGDKTLKLSEYYKKRVLRLLVPHMIAFILMLMVCLIIYPDWIMNTPIQSIICSFFALDYFNEPYIMKYGVAMLWIVGEWFTTVIMILYIVFPLLRWLFKKLPIVTTIVIVGIFLANLHFEVLAYHEAEFSLTNALFAFWMGMMIDKYKDVFFKKYILVPLICAGICMIVLIWNPADFILSPYLLVSTFGILLFVVMLNLGSKSRPIKYLAKYSYEAYLIHHRLLFILLPALMYREMSVYRYILVSVFVIFVIYKLAELLQALVNKIYSGCGVIQNRIVKYKEIKQSKVSNTQKNSNALSE